MKRVSLGLFYTLQGIGNPTYALLVRVVTANPYAIFLLGVLSLPSALSLAAGLILFGKNVDPNSASHWGTVASLFFILFYGFFVANSYSNIVGGYYVYENSIALLECLIIVVLNVVSLFGLYSFPLPKKEPMHEYVPKDTYASLIPKGRFCKQCGKLVSVELGSCPNCGKELE